MSGPSRPVPVLVTGFCDWQRVTADGVAPDDPWRCEHNPSGRLLCASRRDVAEGGSQLDGPLVRALAAQPGVDPRFALMPVRWGAALELSPGAAGEHRVHLGLGVYDDPAVLQLEWGAWPWRAGTDVEGVTLDASLAAPCDLAEAPQHRVRAGTPAMASLAASLEGASFGELRVRVARARADNVFLCNETHWHGLGALARGELGGVWFVHIPNAPLDGLARALTALILRLVRGDMDAPGPTR